MRIGIDARFLTHPQLGGFKTYTENLVRALSIVDTSNSYVVYLDRAPTELTLPQNDNFTYKPVRGQLPLLRMPVREQIALRVRAIDDDLDVLHFLCNTATVGLPAKSVITLHDAIQLTDSMPFSCKGGLSACRRWAISAYSRQIIRSTARSASKLITVSNYEKGQIARCLGIPQDEVCVTHLAPNSLFAPVPGGKKDELRERVRQLFRVPDRFILGVGYEQRKNIPFLIRVFSEFAMDYSNIDLVVVSAERQSRVLFEGLAAELGISNRVTILGAVSPPDLALLYNLAEVLVYPSERESFGLPPLEALACGLPVVAMHATSLPEVLGDAAILVRGKEVADWKEAIVRVISDEKLRASLERKGTEQAAKFSWPRCAKETLQVYHTVVKEN